MLGSKKLFYRHFQSITRSLQVNAAEARAEKVNETKNKIRIPPRIERSPTDILEALASTVQKEIVSFDYKFPDDPHFYVKRNNYRNPALSMESGRNSARWIVQNNPKLFEHQKADPPIEAFNVKQKTDTKEISVGLLNETIQNREVQRSIKVYEALKKKEINVSEETKQKLLELVCFYNCMDKEENIKLESNRFEIEDPNPPSEWKENNFAEILFKSIESNSSNAMTALILGMFKHKNYERGMEYYYEAKNNKMTFPLLLYNELFKVAPNVFQNSDKSDGLRNFVLDELKTMSDNKVKPDVNTLNNVLSIILFHLKGNSTLFVQVLKTFLDLGIQPSLGTYALFFKHIEHAQLSLRHKIIMFDSYLNVMRNIKFEVVHSSDFNFFSDLMEICCNKFRKVVLAHSLHEMYLRNRNSRFIMKQSEQNKYYRKYFTTVFSFEPIDFSMNLFGKHFPGLYSPDVGFFSFIIKNIKKYNADDYLEKIWEYIKLVDFTRNTSLPIELLELTPEFLSATTVTTFRDVALNVLKQEDFWKEGDLALINMLLIFLQCEDEENLLKTLEKMKEWSLVMTLDEKILLKVCEFALSKNNVPLLEVSLKVVNELGLLDNKMFFKVTEGALPLLKSSQSDFAELIKVQQSAKKEKTRKKKKLKLNREKLNNV